MFTECPGEKLVSTSTGSLEHISQLLAEFRVFTAFYRVNVTGSNHQDACKDEANILLNQ